MSESPNSRSQTLADDVHVQKAEEPAPEAESERVGVVSGS